MLNQSDRSASSGARTTRALGVWGNGLVDQPLAMIYTARTWDDVAADELAILIPSLCNGPAEAAVFVRRALVARTHEIAMRPPANAPHSGSDILDLAFGCGAVQSASRRECMLEGPSAWNEMYGAPARAPLRWRDEIPASRAETSLFEMSALASLDRLVSGATSPSPAISLADALVGSIYASVNAAYIYPGLVTMHETLTLGAWLGYLIRRRSALMPLMVAERIVETFAQSESDSSKAGLCEALIRYHADVAAGRDVLLRHAGHVLRTGRSELVKPSRAPSIKTAKCPVWNDALAERLRENCAA